MPKLQNVSQYASTRTEGRLQLSSGESPWIAVPAPSVPSDSNFMADPVLLFSSRWASSSSPHGIHLLPKAILNLWICFYFRKKCQRGRNHFISSLFTIAPGYCFVCLALWYQSIPWFLVPYFVCGLLFLPQSPVLAIWLGFWLSESHLCCLVSVPLVLFWLWNSWHSQPCLSFHLASFLLCFCLVQPTGPWNHYSHVALQPDLVWLLQEWPEPCGTLGWMYVMAANYQPSGKVCGATLGHWAAMVPLVLAISHSGSAVFWILLKVKGIFSEVAEWVTSLEC